MKQSNTSGEPSSAQDRAARILGEMESGDNERRRAAILELAHSDEQIVEIVTEAAHQAAEQWRANGEKEDDFSDWRALDSEPFHFPEEAPNYLEGLYRADKEPAPQKPDPVKLGYLERDLKQIDPLFALLIEIVEHRDEFEAEPDYRAQWFKRAEDAIDGEVLRVYNSEKDINDQTEREPK